MEKIRQFGKVIAGKEYVLRRGGYCVISDATGLIAVVVTPQGAFLPGGAQVGRETPEDAVRREAIEECGFTLKLGSCIGVADEVLFAKAERTYFRKRGTFFTAMIVHHGAPTDGSDHQIVWLPVKNAIRRLVHRSHRWAVQSA